MASMASMGASRGMLIVETIAKVALRMAHRRKAVVPQTPRRGLRYGHSISPIPGFHAGDFDLQVIGVSVDPAHDSAP
jgi:hypothetical protein